MWFGVPALLAVIGRIRRREFSREEGVIAAVVVGHAVLVAAQPLAATLRLFFLRCYREFDVSQTIAVLGLLQ